MSTDTRKALRQGDVMLVPISKLPTNLVPVAAEKERLVVAHGEVTGHHHSFKMTDMINLFREDGSGGGMFVMASAPAVLEHQEHTALELPTGTWEVVRQRTATGTGLSRRVAD